MLRVVHLSDPRTLRDPGLNYAELLSKLLMVSTKDIGNAFVQSSYRLS